MARTGLTSFLRGLTSPSAWSVLSMLLTLALMAGAAIFLLPRMMRSDQAVLLADNPADHQLFVTAMLYRLEESDPRPLVAIVGASVTRSSFGASEAIEAALRERTGRDYQVVNLSTGRQSLLDHMQIIDLLPRDRPVTVVLGLGPSRLTRDLQDYAVALAQPRLGISAAGFDRALRELGLPAPRQTGIAVLDHADFYLARHRNIARNIAKFALGRTIAQNEAEYLGRSLDPEQFAEHSALVLSRFGRDAAISRTLLDRLLDQVSARRNLSLVLVEHPINPRFIDGYLGRRRYQAHLDYMRRTAAAHGVPYWTLGLDARLAPDSYYDWAHIRSAAAQTRLRTLLADRLSATILTGGTDE